MEKLSKKCQAICVCALGCLVTAIVLAPASPTIPQLQSPRERAFSGPGDPGGRGDLPRAGRPGYQPVQNCSGGDSVNCHRAGNQAGL